MSATPGRSGADSKSKKKSSVGSTKKPMKIKKSVLAEQERLVAEANSAANLERARKDEAERKREEQEERQQEERKRQEEEEAERLHHQRSFDSAFLEARANDVAALETAVYEKTSWDKCQSPTVDARV